MKILVVFSGGTIGSSVKNGVISPEESNSYKLLKMYEEKCGKQSEIHFTVVQPFSILSENMDGRLLTKLYNCINNYNLCEFDGVIIAHGTDTLQYTAAYLAYSFGLCGTPIVLISAAYPLDDERSNGMENFCAAVELIRHGKCRGVFVSYKNRDVGYTFIHRASRVLNHLPYDDSVLSMYDNCVYAVYSEGQGVCLNESYTEKSDEISLSDCAELDDRSDVMFLKSYAGAHFPEIPYGTKAVLLEGYHSGTLNTGSAELKKFCKKAQISNIPVYLTGACDGFNYESKSLFKIFKINVLPQASPIAMYMKLWMLKKERIDDVCRPCGGDYK